VIIRQAYSDFSEVLSDLY